MAVPSTMVVAMQQPEHEGSRVLVAKMQTVPVPSLTQPVQKPCAPPQSPWRAIARTDSLTERTAGRAQ
jgi:hypothetical protein